MRVALLLLTLILTGVPTLVHAAPLQRTVIALYDGQRAGSARMSNVHRMAAMPLNWLGLVVRFHNIRDGLPAVWDDPDVRGVVTFSMQPGVPDPAAYVEWAEKLVAAGRKLVVLGELGPTEDLKGKPAAHDLVARFVALLGLVHDGDWSPVAYDARIVRADPAMVGFERAYGDILPPFELYEPLNAATQSYLVIGRMDLDRPSHLIATNPNGGYAASGFTHFRDPAQNFTQWYLNPFAFFEAAFGLGDEPRPDTTTLGGRRMYFSHIDGDGWRNLSLVSKYRRDQVLSAAVVMAEAIAPNPDLPVTVAPIAADLDPDWVGTEQAQKVARDLFALPQVEAASHTYSHPFQWGFFRNYTWDKEKPFLPRYAAQAGGIPVFEGSPDEASEEDRGGQGDEAADPDDDLRPGYSTPRAYATHPFELDNEIGGAIRYIERFAPQGKGPRLVQWSGDTSPFPEALAATAAAGAHNINGGDSRLDNDYPSVSWVAPTGVPVGNTLHIYAAMSNENTYTELWSARFFGYRDLVATLENTERPRRLKPINLYYHMYSGEKQASLKALQDNIAWAKKQEIAPVTATRFAEIAEGFFRVRIEAEGPRTWRVRQRGALQTLRFDRVAATTAPDLAASIGVMGSRRVNDALYVALDPAVPEPRVVLTDQPAPAASLVSARWPAEALIRQADRVAFNSAQGFGPGEMRWQMPAPGRYTISVGGQAQTAEAGSDRMLSFSLPAGLSAGARITIAPLRGG